MSAKAKNRRAGKIIAAVMGAIPRPHWDAEKRKDFTRRLLHNLNARGLYIGVTSNRTPIELARLHLAHLGPKRTPLITRAHVDRLRFIGETWPFEDDPDVGFVLELADRLQLLVSDSRPAPETVTAEAADHVDGNADSGTVTADEVSHMIAEVAWLLEQRGETERP